MPETFTQVITAAIAHFAERGYTSAEELDFWLNRIRAAAQRERIPEAQVEASLRQSLEALYQREIERGGVFRRHPGIGRFTLDRVKPKLRAELDRRIRASANLIKLNREEAVDTTLRRFAGWASTVPPGGSSVTQRRSTRVKIRKELASLPFIERRVAIDQGHKFAASLGEILARDGGALAVKWNSHWRQANYHYRAEHKERDGEVYALRPNWALEKGLMRRGANVYYDEITAFGQEVFCRCYGTWLYALRDLPPDMVTQKGRDELDRVRKLIAA